MTDRAMEAAAREWWIASSPDFHGPVAFSTQDAAERALGLAPGEIVHVREVSADLEDGPYIENPDEVARAAIRAIGGE